jgi:predicted transcriptional regulator
MKSHRARLTRRTHVRVDPRTWDMIERVAIASGKTPSEIMRAALASFLQKETTKCK